MTEQTQDPSRRYLFFIVFFLLLAFLLYQAGRIVAPFFSALLWAAIITLALFPIYRRVLKLVRGKAGMASLIMTLAALVAVIAPAVLILSSLASQAVDLYRWAALQVQSGGLPDAWNRILQSPLVDWFLHFQPANFDLKASVLRGLGSVSTDMATQLGVLLRNSISLILNILILVIALFFFFRDGESYYLAVRDLLPFTEKQKDAIADKFYDTFTAVVNGVFVIALLQGLMTGIGFAIFGAGYPVFWGFVAAVLALVPIGGTALVWIGGAIALYLAGSDGAAVLLALWGAVFVSLPDNFLRPLLIGRKAKISAFLLFIGILGGIAAFGILGILFGPLVVTLLTTFATIYREEFAART